MCCFSQSSLNILSNVIYVEHHIYITTTKPVPCSTDLDHVHVLRQESNFVNVIPEGIVSFINAYIFQQRIIIKPIVI